LGEALPVGCVVHTVIDDEMVAQGEPGGVENILNFVRV
jgi:hypothetical protein